MAAKLLFTSETHQDLDEAFEWYERRRLGLGEEFLIEVADCIDSVCANPELRPKVVTSTAKRSCIDFLIRSSTATKAAP